MSRVFLPPTPASWWAGGAPVWELVPAVLAPLRHRSQRFTCLLVFWLFWPVSYRGRSSSRLHWEQCLGYREAGGTHRDSLPKLTLVQKGWSRK